MTYHARFTEVVGRFRSQSSAFGIKVGCDRQPQQADLVTLRLLRHHTQ
jgi:hypothetical protein